MKEDLTKNIESILKEFGISDPKVVLDYPTHIEMGDFTSNVAMAYAKELGKNPFDLSEEIKSKIILDGVRVEAIKPGFLNFFFDKEYFAENLNKKIESNVFSGQKFFIEHTQPNPLKTFHI
ncbi:MAG TPA: hypothetical protein VGC58_01925, partial [Candidatus Paceibacterota bacterium]